MTAGTTAVQQYFFVEPSHRDATAHSPCRFRPKVGRICYWMYTVSIPLLYVGAMITTKDVYMIYSSVAIVVDGADTNGTYA